MFEENAYEFSEVIMDIGLNWRPTKDISSFSRGRCFAFVNSEKVKAKDMNLTLSLSKNFQYDLYLYPQGIDFLFLISLTKSRERTLIISLKYLQ